MHSKEYSGTKTGAHVFGETYAEQYDLLYTDKDYEAECNLIEEMCRKYGTSKIESILDLGCGTGNHAIPLANRGYRVTGVDISPEMLAIANAKVNPSPQSQSQSQSQSLSFLLSDLRTLDLRQHFDAVLMMFAVLGYQTSNEDVLAALHTVSRHLKPGGLFICDIWFGPAVLKQRPGERVKIIESDKSQVIRVVSSTLDVPRHLTEVNYRLWFIDKESRRLLNETEESHRMRFFFPQELDLFMTCADLELLTVKSFPDGEKAPSEDTWNVIAAAVKK